MRFLSSIAFGGEYTLFAGLEECIKFVESYKFQPTDIEYLRKVLPEHTENEFYDFLSAIDMNDIKVYGIPEGDITESDYCVFISLLTF